MSFDSTRYTYDPERRRVYDTVTKKHLNVRYMWHRDGRSKARRLNKLWRENVAVLEVRSSQKGSGYVGV